MKDTLPVRLIAESFDVSGEYIDAAPFGSGHINDTYAVTYHQSRKPIRYVLQKINHRVFQDVPALMSNVSRVCDHIHRRLIEQGVPEVNRRCLTLVPTRDGAFFFRDPDGNYWRMFTLIEGAKSYDIAETPQHAFTAASAFGWFQNLLTDLPGDRLHETIPDFHHTPRRVDAFERALASDTCNRAASVKAEITWVHDHIALADALLKQYRKGLMPERITHNDTKLNNVLIDTTTREAMCVIDLDTVMPGLALYDFGDLVRTCTSPAAEDEPNLDKVTMRMPMFEALVAGYLSQTRTLLTPSEIESLGLGGMVIAFTMGVRFLTDYLAGDVYYKTSRPGHNLDRCRTQFALVDSMREQQDSIKACINHAVKQLG